MKQIYYSRYVMEVNMLLFFLDDMKQPAAILVIPVSYQNFPVSAILVQILVNAISRPAAS
jgi:hypothetical protein